MTGSGGVSKWSDSQFGDDAVDIAKRVVRGLIRGQRSARAVQMAARSEGATGNYAYGSMWGARYHWVIEEFQLGDLPGYARIRPKGAPYWLAVVDGCVLIPFRHATSMGKPIGQAKLGSMVPRRIARDAGVLPERTLLDELEDATATNDDDSHSYSDSPTVGEVAADARALDLTVVYIAYVANADSDEIQAAWWGTPISLEDDGTMVWYPERLDLSIAEDAVSTTPGAGLRALGPDTDTPGFAQGAEPALDVTPKPRKDELPVSEIEPEAPDAAAEDDV